MWRPVTIKHPGDKLAFLIRKLLEETMQLTPAQIEEYRREGYLFFPGLFTPAEIKTLNDEVPKLYAEERQENVRVRASARATGSPSSSAEGG